MAERFPRQWFPVVIYTQYETESHLVMIPAGALGGLALRAVFVHGQSVVFGGVKLKYQMLMKIGVELVWCVVPFGTA